MNIALIGCGYVGFAVATQLKSLGHHLTVTTRSLQKAAKLKESFDSVEILTGSNTLAVSNLLNNQDVAILCAAADTPQDYASTYLESAKSLLYATITSQKLKQIIYTGSTSIFADHDGATVDETALPSSISETGRILIETEETLLKALNNACSVCLFRLGQIFGPGRGMEARLRQVNGLVLPGSGDSISNLIALNDIVRAITFATEENLSGIYHLCDDLHIPRKELYQRIAENEGLQSPSWDPTKVGIHGGNKTICNKKLKNTGFTLSLNPYDVRANA